MKHINKNLLSVACISIVSSLAAPAALQADTILDRVFGRRAPPTPSSDGEIPRAIPVARATRNAQGVATLPAQPTQAASATKKDEGGTLISFPPGVPIPAWKITRTEWLPQDEVEFGKMVQLMGEDKGCRDSNSCLKRLAVKLGDKDMEHATFWADCAKFPYLLRAYYAWRTGLPFGYVTGMGRAPITPEQANNPEYADWQSRNIRYSINGNYPTRRASVTTPEGGQFPNVARVFGNLGNGVFSATYRMSPEYQGDVFQDFYSARLTRESLQPGTVIYNPNGHVVIVFKIEKDGTIWHMGAGIKDGVVQKLPYGDEYVIGRMAAGGGFRKFRPMRLEGARQNAEGAYIGGRITAPKNQELPLFGLEQYKGVTPEGKFMAGGKEVKVHDYIRWSAAGGVFTYDPLKEFRFSVAKVCTQVRDRVSAVEKVPSSMIRGAHPETLPSNIFATEGDWEEYSSPGRDIRGIRGGFVSVIQTAQNMIMLARQNSPSLSYKISAAQLKASIIQEWNKITEGCTVQYTKTDGSKSAVLNLEEINRRAYLISFDPYHCPERRWGATGSELKACVQVESAENARWYEIEQGLRNLTVPVQTSGMNVPFDQAMGHPALNPVKSRPDLLVRPALDAL